MGFKGVSKMNNSPLVDYTKISPNSTNPRQKKIKKITIHHVAGNLTVEGIGNIFVPSSRSSANYGVDGRGKIGLYVEEKNRSWASSNPDNDHQAVTIEVANDRIGGDWHVSDVALEKTIELCVDICERNNIEKLIYTGTSAGSLTRHNMFANTVCPGPYLQSKFPYIESEVNRKLDLKRREKMNKPSDWAKEAWEWAIKNGITDGSRPQNMATREEIITMIYRAIGGLKR